MRSFNKKRERLMAKLMRDGMGKKGQAGLISSNFNGVIGLVFTIVVGFVGIGILFGAGLLEAGSAEDNASRALVANLTTGVTAVGNKIPTIFTIAVAVLLLGLIVFLALRARQAQQAQGGSI